jgi:predicted NBD/HSP70 family sugar kinase
MRGDLDSRFHVLGIGLAIPGLVRGADGFVSLAPHLDWRDEPIAEMLHAATGYRVWAANDATCGAIAESVFGVGRDVKDMIYLNGGASGIGGGVISDGALLSGANGYAGELGHTLVNSNGVVCHCGAVGCLETEVSRAPLLAACGLTDTESERLEEVLLALCAQPNPPAELVDLIQRQAGFLAIALRNFINIFNTRRIVLGGFLSSLYQVAPEQLDRLTRSGAMVGARDGIEIVRATLGSEILLVGAAELAFAELLADPASIS